MAYLRYSRTCPWYVYEDVSDRLSIQHKNDRMLLLDADEVRELLTSQSFIRIPGYSPEHHPLLEAAFRQWLAELEKD